MRTTLRRAVGALAMTGALAWAPSAFAHPEVCGKEGEHDQYEAEMCFTDEQIAGFDDSGATLGAGEMASTRNMKLLANLPKSGPFTGTSAFNSDMAFWGRHAIQGNYNGFQITDISEPENPRIVAQESCPGSQNDVSVWKNLIFTSTDSRRSDDSCNSFALGRDTVPSSTDPNAEYWEGIKIFDWSNPAAPELIKTIETDCGSHTHTLLPDEANDRVLLYVSSYDLNVNAKDCRLTSTPQDDHDKISIIEVPLADPTAARVIAEPVLFPDGGYAGDPYTRQTRGCHDITAYPALSLALGACMGEGVVLDISNPENPVVLSSVRDPNFAFWHSATFSNDGSKAIFTDELGGGGQPTCNPSVDANKGADAIYDIRNRLLPSRLSYFKIPRTQWNTENCVAHNGVVLPTSKRDVFVQGWYQGGTSVIDFTDGADPTELGWIDRGPLSESRRILGGSWSSYFYNGFIFANDIQMGLDVIAFTDAARSGTQRMKFLNPQTQYPLAR